MMIYQHWLTTGSPILGLNDVILYNHELYKSSAVAEMGDRGHNRNGPKRGVVPLSWSAGNPSNTMWSARSILRYQVASSSIQPFGNSSVRCHSLRRNISTNYYFVVEMLTVTIRSDDAQHFLKKFN